MTVLFIIILIIAVLVLLLAYLNRVKKSNNSEPTTPSMPYTETDDGHRSMSGMSDADTHQAMTHNVNPKNIAVGDLIEYAGKTYRVEGTLEFDEGGYIWKEHNLGDGNWLSVEDDDEIEVVLYQRHPNPTGLIPQKGQPMEVDGIVYRHDESGKAKFIASGRTGTAVSGKCRYADFVSADGRSFLGFEDFGDDNWELSVGERLPWGVYDVMKTS